MWILRAPGIDERVFVADQATVTVYFKDVDPGRFTGHLPPQAAPQQQYPGAWQQQPTTPAPQTAPAAQQPAAPQRHAAPWTKQPRG